MRKKALLPVAAILLVAAAMAAAGAPAALHLALSKAEPGVDATVTTAPRSINLFFTQAPQLRATAVQLKTRDGAPVALGDPKADAADAKIIRIPVAAPLAPGTYEVAWRVLASDGHVVSGSYHFTYRLAEGASN